MSRRAFLRLRRTAAARADIDYDGVTRRVRDAWERSEPDGLLRALEPVAAVVAETAGAAPGQRVLDVGAGDGNVALACAAAGAEVEACDLAAAMVARGRVRSGDAVTWRRADAQALPYPDARFDGVVSAFGAPLAPRARRTARELVRVCRPGGRVVLAAWIPRGLPGGMFELLEEVEPLPDGVSSPARWGVTAAVQERLGPLLEALELRTRTVRLEFASPDALFAALAPATVDAAGRAAIRPRFDRLLAAQNNRPPGAEIDGRYLLAAGRRPA